MSRSAALARGRLAAEAGMTDACVIEHRTGTTTNDLNVVDTFTTVYSGRCRVQQAQAMGQRVDSGEAAVVVLRLDLQLPVVGSEAVNEGDRVTVTSALNDAALIGRKFTIRDLHHKSEATARRMTCEEPT